MIRLALYVAFLCWAATLSPMNFIVLLLILGGIESSKGRRAV
jgi:hypothetical protein